MSTTNHHIDNISQAHSPLLVGLVTLGGIGAFLGLFSQSLASKMANWITKMLSNLDKKVADQLEQVKSTEYTKDRALKLHRKSKKALSKFTSIHTKMEKVDFFYNEETKNVADELLLKFYSLESNFRKIAFAETPSIPEDKNLIAFASDISLGSLPA